MRRGSKTATAPASSSSVTAGEVREQECCLLLGPPFGAPAEQDDGRPARAAGREERSEVGVGGDEDPALRGGSLQDLLVGYCLKAVIADVHRVVPRCSKVLG